IHLGMFSSTSLTHCLWIALCHSWCKDSSSSAWFDGFFFSVEMLSRKNAAVSNIWWYKSHPSHKLPTPVPSLDIWKLGISLSSSISEL
uniref:Uncharacterized protein n=1 Tax=Astyanax mexicanus TaxID=7994 RepID=A0A8B9LIE5_ASTMX